MNFCGSLSLQGSVCTRPPGHGGCHEDTRTGGRWWGDARDYRVNVPAPDGWAVAAEDDGQLGLVPA